MTIETKYEYTYYTVINISSYIHCLEQFLEGGHFNATRAIEFIEGKFKNSEDKSVNNYKVDYAQYCDDIASWIRAQHRHKDRPIFVQFQDDGDMFVLYEEEEDEVTIEQAINDHSYWNGPDGIDGLSGAGGRL